MERRRVGFQVHIRAAIAQLHFSLESDSQHFVGHASLVLARESKNALAMFGTRLSYVAPADLGRQEKAFTA